MDDRCIARINPREAIGNMHEKKEIALQKGRKGEARRYWLGVRFGGDFGVGRRDAQGGGGKGWMRRCFPNEGFPPHCLCSVRGA